MGGRAEARLQFTRGATGGTWPRSLLLLLAALFLLPASSVAAVSGDFYVSTATGSDTTGTGTQAAPWKTIGKAVSHVTTNGLSGAATVWVDQGTYAETVSIGAISGSSSVNTLTIKPDPGDAVAVTSSGLTDALGFSLSAAAWVAIEGIEIRNTRNHGLQVTNSQNITLAKLDIHDVEAARSAVRIDSGSTAVTVKQSKIRGFRYGVHIFQSDGNRLENLMVIGGNDQGVFVEESANTKIYFCSFRDEAVSKPDDLLKVQPLNAGDGGTEIRNCAFHLDSTSAADSCIRIQNANATWTSNYNAFYPAHGARFGTFAGNGYSTLASWRTATGQDANSIETNPFFKSATDLHIVGELNALLRQGLFLEDVTTDFDGVSRANFPTIGAHENPPANSLTGTYVIDPAGGGNYTTFTAAVADLLSRGIKGAVVFQAKAATYTEPGTVLIRGISGASSARTVTFRPEAGATVTLTENVAGAETVKLDGASYVVLEKLKVQAPDGHGVRLTANSDFNVLKGVRVFGMTTGTTTAVFIEDGSEDNVVDSCTLEGKKYGLQVNGANRTTLKNSFLIGGTENGAWVTASSDFLCYHNSFRNTTDGNPDILLHVQNTNAEPGVKIKNNAFHTSSTAAGDFCVKIRYASTEGSLWESDFNCFWAPSAAKTGHFNGNGYDTLAAWRTATGKDASSIEADPKFASGTNLHLLTGSPCIGAGTPIASVPLDIDGHNRSPTTPDIGADEFVSTVLLQLADHPAGQQGNAFVPTNVASQNDAEIYSFKLVNEAGTVKVKQVVFSLTGVTGLAQADITDLKIVVDGNGDGNVGAGETTTAGGAGVVNSSVSTITFSEEFLVPAATNYILTADFANLAENGDTVTVSLPSTSISAEDNAVPGVPIDTYGVISKAKHTNAVATYYVNAATGSDTNPGTFEAPFKTVKRACQAVNPGDTVLIYPGKYQEDQITPAVSGTQTQPITFRGLPGADGTHVVEMRNEIGDRVWRLNATSWIVLDNLVVVGGSRASIQAKQGASNLTFRSLIITGGQQEGIELNGGSNATVVNCLVYRNGKGVLTLNYPNVSIANSTLAENTVWGVEYGQNCTGGSVRRSILAGNYQGIKVVASAESGFSADYNLNVEGIQATGVSQGPNTLTTDPLFWNAVEQDYHLQPSSPALDKGEISAVDAGLAQRTTQVSGTPDTGIVDLGFHYPDGKVFVVDPPQFPVSGNPTDIPSNVRILAPSTGTTFQVNTPVTFFGEAFNPDDQTFLTHSALKWYVDGAFQGTGERFTFQFTSTGTKTVKLLAHLPTGDESVQITVSIQAAAVSNNAPTVVFEGPYDGFQFKVGRPFFPTVRASDDRDALTGSTVEFFSDSTSLGFQNAIATTSIPV